jgi:glycosyltransferase involved in cell wall biosynthesis
MPSWAEGGPLAALEAAAAGLPLVLSDHADEREYFEGVATFVDPADPRQIRSAILEAIHSPVSPRVRHDRQDRMQLRFGWARHVDATLGVYREVQCPGHSSVVRDVAIGAIPRIETEIVLDVTTLVNHSGRWTGISRVEAALVLALQGVNRNRLTLIAWSDRQRRFIRLPTATISPCALRAAVVQQEASATSLGQFPLLSRLVVCGSAWMQNPRYVGGLAALVETHRLRLTAVIHDVIPLKSPHWFPEHYEAKFRENLRCILGTASSVIVISKATASDVMQACTELGILGYPPMATWRLGDDLPFADGHPDELVRDRLDNLPFVLAVGAIHTRKNYGVLYQAWLQLKRCMPDRCPRLVIVGGTAWNGDETAKAFKGDVQIAHLVNILDDVDDATLRWLYENAALTVYPSLDEGWGLPVAESLRFGTPCIASAIPTMSEIAPELVETLDPHDPLIWATRIQLLVSSPLARAAVANRIRAEYRPITWAAAGKHLLACIEALEPAEALSKGLRDVVSLGIPLHLREEVLRGVRFIDGWGPAGDIGRWIVKDRATCIVGLEAGLAGPHLFAAEISLGPVVLSCVVEIWICDALVCTWLVQQGERRQHFAVFEPPHLHERCQLEVDLRIGDVQAAPVVSDASCPSAKLQVHAIALARLQDVRTIDSQFGKHAGALRPGSWYDFRRERLASAGAPTTDRGAFHESLSSRVILRVHDALDEELELEIGLRTESSIEHPTSLSIMVNSQEIVTCLAVHAGPTRIKARLPNAVRFLQDPITVDVFSAGHGKDTSTPRACSLLAVRFVGRSGPCGLEASELHHLDEAAPPTTKQLAALGPEWLIGDGALEWEGFEAILPVQVGGLALRLRFSVRLETEIAGLDHIDFIVSARRKVLAIHTLMSEMKTVDVLIPSSSANDAEVAELRLTLRPVASSGAPMRHRTVPRIRAQLISARYEDGLVFVYDDVPEPASEIYSISSADYNARRIDNQYNRTHSGRVLQEWDMRSRNADLRASSIGLFRPEDEGSWTDAKFARLQLSLPQSVKIPITVAVFARVFGTAKTGIAEVEVRFSSGSEAVWTYPDDDWRWHYVTVEPAAGGTIDWLAVDFVRRDAITPKEMSGANDSRLLGLYLQKIAIVMPSNDEVVH